MSWKTAKVPSGGKLFQVHNFAFLFKGKTFELEVDEYQDGTFSGHGEQANDQSNVIGSVSGKNLSDCINQLISKIQSREG